MAEFLQNFFRKLGKGSPSSNEPQAFLGVYGKHPCFNEHFDQFGAGVKRLPDLMAMLYREGIQGNLESEAWAKLEPDKRLDYFNHVFVVRTGDEIIAGRFSSSHDSVGRDAYPFVVCAESRGFSPSAAVGPMLRCLERIQSRCADVRSLSVINSIIESGEQELRLELAAASTAPADDDEMRSARALSELADCPDLGSNRQGLHRILFRVERELEAYHANTAMTTSKIVKTQPEHMRVPQCGGSPDQIILRWMDFLLAMVHPSVPMLAMMPLDKGWVDLIVGRPMAEHAFFLRAAGEAVTSDVPYALDQEFIARAESRIAQARTAPGSGVLAAPHVPRDSSPALAATTGDPQPSSSAGNVP